MKTFKILLTISLFSLGFFASLSAQVIEGGSPRDNFYDKVWVDEKLPIPLPFVRQADVMWEKTIWQIIDLREKINHPLYYPENTIEDRKSLMAVLLNAVNEGSIRAFNPANDEFTLPMTPEEVRNTYSRTQVREIIDPVTLQPKDSTFTFDLTPQEVTKYRIKEKWFFDSKRSVLDVRIIGICPVRERIDPVTNESRGDQALFWIYFPEARNVLVNYEVFNRFNDAQRVSYDDLFLRRMFNSFIYKESNVYDREIREYMVSGLDQLLEADKIKDDIRNFEHDLWEY